MLKKHKTVIKVGTATNSKRRDYNIADRLLAETKFGIVQYNRRLLQLHIYIITKQLNIHIKIFFHKEIIIK